MKKAFLFFLLLMITVIQARATNINKIVFFGDSLSDNGNLYSLLLHLLPTSPYFQGHFSNGTTWAENVGKYYYNKNKVDYKIYAIGGATAIFHMPTTKFIAPTLLDLEVDAYLIDSIFKDRSKVLFVIWIGSNDYLFYPDVDVDAATDQIVNHIARVINTLKDNGGKNFLVFNLPDLSRTPEVKQEGAGLMVRLHTLSVLHNQKLDAAIQKIQGNKPAFKITLINIFAMFNELMDNPNSYNQKYHTKLINTTDACWAGGYMLKQVLSEAGLAKEIQQAFATRRKHTGQDIDAQAISNYIINTPELSFAYRMNKAYEQGDLPCAHPDDYIFWDAIHPSAATHAILAKAVVEQLGQLA